MSRDSLLLPGAVLVGAAIIGAGLYFGLRAQSPAPGAPPLQPEAVRPLEPPAAPNPAAPNPAIPNPATPNQPMALPAMPLELGTPEAKARATTDAKAAVLAEKKANWTAKCWAPALATNKEPATSKYSLSLAFDADGKQSGQGVSELRGEPSRPDVSTCLSRQPMNLKIPPPGMPVNVEIQLEFP